MKRILIGLMLVTLLLLTSYITRDTTLKRVAIDGFTCTYVNLGEREVCKELTQSYLIYATLKDQNILQSYIMR